MDAGMPFLLDCASIEENAALCRELRLDFLELNMSFPPCAVELLTESRLKGIQDRYGIGLTIHLHESMDPCAFNTAVRGAWIEEAVSVIRLARVCGIPTVNLHWSQGIYITLPDRKVFMREAYRGDYLKYVTEFRQVCSEASGGAVSVCIENTDGWLPFQQEAVSLLLEDSCFGLTLDIGHLATADFLDRDFYARHFRDLRHMHAHDSTKTRCHLPFGEGSLNLPEYLGLARNAGARVVLEVKTPDALRRSVELARKNGWIG